MLDCLKASKDELKKTFAEEAKDMLGVGGGDAKNLDPDHSENKGKITEWQGVWNITNAIQGMFIVSLPYGGHARWLLGHPGHGSAWPTSAAHTGGILVESLYEPDLETGAAQEDAILLQRGGTGVLRQEVLQKPLPPRTLDEELKFWGLAFRGGMVILTVVFAMVVPHLTILMGFIGNFTGCCLSIWPAYFYLWLRWHSMSWAHHGVHDMVTIFLDFGFSTVGMYISAKAMERASLCKKNKK